MLENTNYFDQLFVFSAISYEKEIAKEGNKYYSAKIYSAKNYGE